jgi:hypothetical protein
LNTASRHQKQPPPRVAVSCVALMAVSLPLDDHEHIGG